MQREALDKWWRGLESTTPIVGGWIRRHSLERLVRENSPEAVRQLAEFVASHPEESPYSTPVLQALARVASQNCRDAICEVWSRTRTRALSELIQQQSWVAGAPPNVRVLTALLCNEPASLAREPEQVAPALFEALDDPNSEIAAQARELLFKPSNPAMRSAFVELAMLEEGRGRQAILKAGHLPKDPERRALFLFLTGQDAAFEALDFDFSLISKAYRGSTSTLRSRVNQRLRQSGRPELLAVLADSPYQSHSSARTWGEWETVFEVLSAAGAWDALWKHISEAPLEWSARVVRGFRDAGQSPPDSEADLFRELMALLPEPDDLRRLGFGAVAALGENHGPIQSIAGTRSGDLLAVLHKNDAAALWELPAPHQTRWQAPGNDASTPLAVSLVAPQGGQFSRIEIAPGGQFVSAIGDSGEVCVWDRKGKLRRNSRVSVRPGSTSIAFADGGNQLAILLRRDVLVWNTREPDRADLFLRAQRGKIRVMTASADGNTLVTGEEYGAVCIWVMPEGRRTITLQMDAPATALLVTETYILGADERAIVHAWERDTGRLIRNWILPEGPITHLALSPDENWLAIGCGNQLTYIRRLASDVACKQPGRSGGNPIALGFLSDDCLIICPRNRQVVAWNPESGEAWDRPSVDLKRATAFWLDPDHQQFAVAGSEGVVRFFQAISTGPRSGIDPEALIKRLRRAEDPRTVRALKYTLALLRHPTRFDIAIGEAAPVDPRLFDIEIEG